MRLSERREPRLADRAAGQVRTSEASVDLALLKNGTAFGGKLAELADCCVLVATDTQIASVVALVELDGVARRLVIAPPGLKPEHLAAVSEDAGVNRVVTDDPSRFGDWDASAVVPISLSITRLGEPVTRHVDTEWALLTSGTSGRPKIVAHTFKALTGAMSVAPPGPVPKVWATFYDIRRYGGLQILLRAIFGGTDLVLSSEGETIGDHLHRLGQEGVTSISGTPSHWRRVLMSQERSAFAPSYIRLSGEIADQIVLDGLKTAYPHAAIGHAYASTEAGVGFAVDDGLEGFPVSFIGDPTLGFALKVEDDSLRIRSRGAASRYVGGAIARLADEHGFIDTGDLVERRGERYVFVGRRGGIINVGGLKVNPEEVEATINSHEAVRVSLVQARRNPLTGAIVVADIVLRDNAAASDQIRAEILAVCRGRLDRHKVPALVRFVPSIPLTDAGKLRRNG